MGVVEYTYDSKINKVVKNGVKVVEHTKSNAGERRIYLNKKARDVLYEIKQSNFRFGYYDDDIFL